MKKLFLNLQFLFKPWYWIVIGPYSEAWDRKLNWLLDCYEPTYVDEHTCKLGDETIWIANMPYGAGVPYDYLHAEIRASRLTVKRLWDAIDGVKKTDPYLEAIRLGELTKL